MYFTCLFVCFLPSIFLGNNLYVISVTIVFNPGDPCDLPTPTPCSHTLAGLVIKSPADLRVLFLISEMDT